MDPAQLAALIAEQVKAGMDALRNELKTPNPNPFQGGTAENPGKAPGVVIAPFSSSKAFEAKDPLKGKGLNFARVVRSVALASVPGSGMSALEAAESLGYKELATRMEAKQAQVKALAKAMNESTFVGGGAWVPDEDSNEFIDLLEATSVLASLGAFNLTMKRQSLTIPKLTKGLEAGYIGESQAPELSEAEAGAMQFQVKKLAAATVLSMDLLRDASIPVEALIRTRLQTAMGLKMDLQGLRGKGGQHAPKGLRYLIPASQLVALAGGSGATYAQYLAFAMDLIGRVEDSKVPLQGCAFVMTHRARRKLAQVQDAGGRLPWYADLMKDAPTWLGYRVVLSNQIPNTLGAGTNETEITFGSFPHFYIAQNMGVEIKASDVAAYVKSGGQLASAFSQDEMVLQAIARHDFDIAYDTAFSVGTAVVV